MNCPFKITTTYSIDYASRVPTQSQQEFGMCDNSMCMAYDMATAECRRLAAHKVDNQVSFPEKIVAEFTDPLIFVNGGKGD